MVFTQTYEPGTIKPYSRWQVILIAIPAMLAPILSIISAKLSPVSLAFTLIAVSIFAYSRGGLKFPGRSAVKVSIGFLAFAAFAGLSALWSPVPGKSLIAAISFAAIFAVALECVSLLASEQKQPTLHMAEGVWIGFLLASIYYAADVLTGQSIKIMVFNALGLSPGHLLPKWAFWKDGKVVGIPLSDATRNAFALPLLLWSALMATSGVSNLNLKKCINGLLILVVCIGVFLSPNDTAKLALVIGTIAFILASYSRTWSLRVVVAAWFAATLLAIPIAFALSGSNLEDAKWLPVNGASRIKIWTSTANETLKSPIVGVGANSTAEITKRIAELKKSSPEAAAAFKGFSTSPHAHNIYLQTWFELGVLGAGFLSLCGYGLLSRIGALSERAYAYGLATFASGAMLSASSYGLWQLWFLSMFAWTICVFEIGRRVLEDDYAKKQQPLRLIEQPPRPSRPEKILPSKPV